MEIQNLTNYIFELIMNKSDVVLTDGLYNGKMGLALCLNAFSKEKIVPR